MPSPDQRCDKQSCPFSGSTMGNLPIGQGLSVTPIQMAAAYSAIADGGILRPPQLVLDRGDDPVAEPAGRRVISAGTAAQLRTDARGRAGPRRHGLGGERARLHAGGQDGNLAGGGRRRLLGLAVHRLVRRLRAGRRTPGCWSRWSSTSRRAATTTAAPWPRPRSARSPSSRFPIWRSRRTRPEPPRWRPRIASMELRELLAGVAVAEIAGDGETEIAGLAYDSRRVEPGDLFFCVRGQRSDGHEFADRAVEQRGRRAGGRATASTCPATQVMVADARAAMPPIAVGFWGDPTASLRVAGVTGTNGKTTTAFLIRHVLEAHGTPNRAPRDRQAGRRRGGGGGRADDPGGDRPPGDLPPHARGGRPACAMEVSSHALALGRTAGVRFAVAVFTNLTQDHLDFHRDMEEYFEAKRALFSSAAPGAAVVNVDDPYGARLAAELREDPRARLLTFSPGGSEGADLRALDVAFDSSGSRFRCLGPEGEVVVRTALPGHFNVENSLAALAACEALGVPSGGRGRLAGRRRSGAGPLRAGRGGPAVRGPGRLRAHPRLAGERAAGGAQADRRDG